MYLHVGDERLIHNKDIIGIFNIQYIRNTREYKSMYKDLEEKGNLIDLSEGEGKSFILIEKNNEKKGYIAKIGANTILKRLI
jgi:hypothetical protein